MRPRGARTIAVNGGAAPFGSVLVANRGEIAVRIIRACRDLGMRSVAVYSDADRDALHVRMADEAYPIGPASPRESYLAIPKLVAVAKHAGCDAVHPGYGFLSENADFADAVANAGIAFVGPPASVQRLLGEKTRARRIAQEAGVDVADGTIDPLRDLDEARAGAARVGYPVMLKAAGRGGG
ncbi:MAG: biotin carboxylase N-terminal domain-containing protein, partial [Chloroflexota bacterium]